jgi:acyl-CoA synthetase (AMP-forming)/AMP-acid ligase II
VTSADLDFPTIASLLAARASERPSALAFTFEEESLTYAELVSDAEAIAGILAHDGIERGDRVAMLMPAGLDLVRVFYALQRIGAVPCIFDPAVAKRAERIAPKRILTAVPTGSGAALPPIPTDAETIAFLQPTSGTTGEPRAAVLLQRHLMASLSAARQVIDPVESDALAGWVPPWHDLGLLRFLLGSVAMGLPCHLIQPSVRTIPQWFATISARRATITGAPDFAWRLATRLVDPRAVDLSSMRYATNGGEPVRATTIEAFEQRFGLGRVILPGYGLAEAGLGVTTSTPGRPLRLDERRHVSCGTPLPNVEVRIEGDEILVRGPSVFAGYLGDELRHVEWLHTGDAGHLDADGHLYVLGRRRAMIKRGGAPLAPRELEEAAQSVAGVRIAAAVGLPGALTEEVVVVVEASDAPADLQARVAAAVEEAIGFAPDRVLVQEPRTIPRTPNGKIQHGVLREQLLTLTLGAAG